MADSTTLATVPATLDDYFIARPEGSVDLAIRNHVYGINHRHTPGLLPMNKDHFGYTFFTRPQLNLQDDNVRQWPQLYNLLNSDPFSPDRIVRSILDPRLARGYSVGKNKSTPPVPCPLVDMYQAFIPVLTNALKRVTGGRDLVSQAWTSKPGLYQETYTMIDGGIRDYGTYDLEFTFRNIRGDFILSLVFVWQIYTGLALEGILLPYWDFITENEVDSDTRIYRITLDETKQYAQKLLATGYSFPISNPTGQFFDYDTEKNYNVQSKEITIRFRCSGFLTFEPRLIYDFNQTVIQFNPAMHDAWRDQVMVRIDPVLLEFFNHQGYPRINPNDNRMEWWLPSDYFTAHAKRLLANGLLTDAAQKVLNSL